MSSGSYQKNKERHQILSKEEKERKRQYYRKHCGNLSEDKKKQSIAEYRITYYMPHKKIKNKKKLIYHESIRASRFFY